MTARGGVYGDYFGDGTPVDYHEPEIQCLHEREIFRRNGSYYRCQILNWQKGLPPKFLACWDPNKQDNFIAAQRMGTWAEIDIYEVERRLNGNWPELRPSQSQETVK